MTAAAILSLQNLKHIDRIGAYFFLENDIVAVFAIEPFGVLRVWKEHHGHDAGVFHDDVHVEKFDSGVWENVRSWFDITLTQSFDP